MSIMTIPISRKTFTVSDYYKMAETGIIKPDDRVELLNGEIITMSPIKSFHAGIVNYLCRVLNEKLKGKATILPQNPIHLNNRSEPEPDISVAKFKSDDYRQNHPTADELWVVIEVADSSLNVDRTIKAPLFAEANIPEYWIINIPEKQIEVFKKPENGKYQISNIFKKGKLSCEAIEFEILLEEVF